MKKNRLTRMTAMVLALIMIIGTMPAMGAEVQPGDPYSGMRDEYVVQANRGVNGGQRNSGADADGRTARYIVKYREGRAASFESKIASRLEAAASIAEPMQDTETGRFSLYEEENRPAGGRRGDGKENSRVQVEMPAGSNIAANMSVIILKEPALPSEFARDLQALGAGSDIIYIMPDLELQLAGFGGGAEDGAGGGGSAGPGGAGMPGPATREVTVAVIDGGMDTGHEAFEGYLHSAAPDTPTQSLSSAHATHLAGTLVRVAKQTGADIKILPINVFTNGTANTSDVVAAINYAASMGAEVINCSFGTSAPNKALQEAIAACDALLVAAVGNNRRSFDETPSYPAGYCVGLPNVISVASVNPDGGFSFFSNRGRITINITAVGRDVYSAFPGNKYGTMSGTSMSAAYVSGAAASILSGESMEAGELRDRLIYTADKLTNLQDKVNDGRRINLANALSGQPGATLVLDPEDDFDANGYVRTKEESWRLFSSTGTVQISAAGNHTLILKSDGSVWTFGDNVNYSTSPGCTVPEYYTAPEQVIGLTDIVKIAAGEHHNLAIRSDGTLWAWGDNSYGQLGDGTGAERHTPVQTIGIMDAVDISAGACHSLVALSGGDVYGMGDNSAQQLANDNFSYTPTPEQIPGLSGVCRIDAKENKSLAVENGGDAWIWGAYYYKIPFEEAVRVYELEGNAARVGTLIKTDGSLWEWSAASDYPGYYFEECQMGGLSGIADVSGDAVNGLALQDGGTVWQMEWSSAWQVAGLEDIVSVANGYGHYLALDMHGNLWAYGDNTYGQLGDGTTTGSSVPVLVLAGPAPGNPGEPARVDVSISPGTVYIPQSGTATAYASATVIDCEFSILPNEEVQWSIASPGLAGVSIDQSTGAIAVAPSAQAGAATITATSATDSLVSGTAGLTVIALTGITVQLSHESIWIPEIETNIVEAQAFDQHGTPITMGVTWILEGVDLTDVKIDEETGQVAIGTEAVPGTVEVTATSSGVSGSAFLELEPAGTVTVTLTPNNIEAPLFGYETAEAKAFDDIGRELAGEVKWSLGEPEPVGVYIRSSGLIYIDPNAEADTITVQAVYQGVPGSAELTVTRPLEDGTLPAHWKFMRLHTADDNYELSACFFAEQKTYLYGIYNPKSTATELKFALQFGQDVALAVYKMPDGISLDDLREGALVGPYHPLPDVEGPELKEKDFVGWLTTGEESESGESGEYMPGEAYSPATPYTAKGYNGELRPAGGPRPSPLPFCPPAVHEHNNMPCESSLNLIAWDGFVTDAQGASFRLGEGIGGCQGYVIVIKPLDPYTAKYESYLGIAVDYSVLISGQLGLGSYIDQYGNIINDPLDIITGNFTWSYTDVEAFGAEPLSWTRTYNSQDGRGIGPLGHKWRHSYQFQVIERPLTAQVVFPDGASLTYNKLYSGGFEKPIGTDYMLYETPYGFRLSGRDKTEYAFDSAGNIMSITDAGGLVTNFTYTGGNLTQITNSSGSLTIGYDTDGLIASVTDGTDKEVQYSYDQHGNLETVTNPDGDTLTYAYDDRCNILEVKDFNGNVYMRNTFDDKDRITSQMLEGQGTSYMQYFPEERKSIFTDARGLATTYYYDENQMLIATEDSESGFGNAFDAKGRLTARTDRLGNTTSYDYDGSGNILSISYPDNTSESYTYNNLNLPLTHTARDGHATYYSYDIKGNLTAVAEQQGAPGSYITRTIATYEYDHDNNMVSSTDALGATTEYTYDSRGNTLTVTDPLGSMTGYAYDAQGRLERADYPDGSFAEYEYTTAGKLLKATDAENNEVSYGVSGNGFNTGVEDAMGFSTETVYNIQNQPISVTDAMGNATTYAYDAAGALVSTTDALGNTVAYSYDVYGRMESMTDAMGNTWRYEYDAEGRAVKTTDPLYDPQKPQCHSTATAYDEMGRAVSARNARGAQTTYSYDAMGRQARVTDHYGNYTESVYSLNGNLMERRDKNGNVWSYVYDANNRLFQALDPMGGVTAYTYDALGRTTAVTTKLNDFESAVCRSVYDSMGRLLKSIDAEGNETGYEYDILGRLVKTMFADGTSTVSQYNANGWLTKSIAPDGGATVYAYNSNGQVLAVTNTLNQNTLYTTSYAYDALGRTISATDALGGVTAYAYDANGRVLTATDAEGGVTAYAYDALGRVATVTDPMLGATAIEYDENGNIVKIVNPDGGVTTYAYDMLDRLASSTDPEGYTTSYAYDANGNTLTVMDGNLNTSETEYDSLNRAVKRRVPLGGNAFADYETEYDEGGRVVKSTGPEGAVTSYGYDLNGNIAEVADALGNVTTFTYDGMNRVATAKDARNATTAYAYTATGQVAAITNALGGVRSYQYDLLGRLVSETDETGKTTSYTYDALGRALTVTNPLGHTDSFTYDLLGRVKTVTDKNGNTTSYNYDASGNIIETIDALGNSSFFEYDPMNRLTKVTLHKIDPRQSVPNQAQITLYEYDKRGLVTKEVNAAGFETEYEYDGNGNLIEKVDADGFVTTYSYDPRNLVKTINYSGGKTAQFAYNANGELVEMQDWNGTTSFALDLLGRITSVNDHNNKLTQYTYDDTGNKTSMTYPDNSVVNYTYDLLGRLTGVNDAENQNTAYGYDAASRLVSQSYPNGWFETCAYDAAGQLLTQVATDPTNSPSKTITRAYAYDPQGNILTESRNGANGQPAINLSHTYDALNRLASTYDHSRNNAFPIYEYDSLGNLVKEKTGNGSNKGNEYWYNELNRQVKKVVDNKDSYLYTFDNRGNLVKGAYHKNQNHSSIVESYVYDETNRMVLGTNEIGETSAYNYNGLGHLVSNTWTAKKNAYGYTGVSDLSGLYTFDDFIAAHGADAAAYVLGVIDEINSNISVSSIGGSQIPINQDTTDAGGQPLVIALDLDIGLDEGAVIFRLPMELVSVYGIGTILNQTSVVTKDYVIDYTSALADVIMEVESGAGSLAYRYVYGLQKLSVSVSPITTGAGNLIQNGRVKLWHHQDRLGSTDFLTDNIAGKAASYVTYDSWGAPTMKAILKMGIRELDLVTSYTGHPYDPILGVYYAKARMYDADDRRFMAVDWVGINLANPGTYNEYAYVWNNPVCLVDLFGLLPELSNMPQYVSGVAITVMIMRAFEHIQVFYKNDVVYIDFFQALRAFGICTPRSTSGYIPNIKYSGGVHFTIDVTKDSEGASYTFFDGAKTTFTGDYYHYIESTSIGLLRYDLVPLKYFMKMMACLGYQTSKASSGVELLTMKEVEDLGAKTGRQELIDLKTGWTIWIYWKPPGAHTDWSPMSSADTDIIKRILNPYGKIVDWGLASTWESFDAWAARPGILKLKGKMIAVGFHLRPHSISFSRASGLPNCNLVGEAPEDGWPLGGHMCMYYGDSSNKSAPKYNTVAKEVYSAFNFGNSERKTLGYLDRPPQADVQ